MELLFVPKWAERPSLFHSDVPAGAHRALKVTSLALTSASFPQGFKEKRVDCIPSQNVRDAACIAHFFFFFGPAHSNNEDNSVQKSNQVFWHELCCSNPQNLLSHHCQVGQILIRARSNPGQDQGWVPLARCLILLLTQRDLHTCS